MHKLVPELDVLDLTSSIEFYAKLGFGVQMCREDEGFVSMACGDVQLMLQTAHGPGRRFRTADLERPHGRGMNLQLEVDDVLAIHTAMADAGRAILIDLEDRWYAIGDRERGHRQFVVKDPDGYLWRPFQCLGTRAK